MTTLHLGVIDQPYANGKDAETTGDVAGWLENRYHIMEIFYRMNEAETRKALETSVAKALEAIISGAPVTDPFAGGTSTLEHRFKEFLTLKVMEGLGYPGVPTQAALEGVNHRLKLRRGPRRPSFIDTGLYQASFKAWVTPD